MQGPEQDHPSWEPTARYAGFAAAQSSRSNAPPSLPRLYETTVWDESGSGDAVRILSIPHPPDTAHLVAFDQSDDRLVLDSVISDLGLRRLHEVEAANFLNVLYGLLGFEYPQPPTEDDPGQSFQREQLRKRFVARVLTEPLVAMEASPPRGVSIVDVLTSSGTVSAYAYFSNDPLLLLAAPAGIVVIGAARGVGRALDHGLYERVFTRITGRLPLSDAEIDRRDEAEPDFE